MLRKISKYQMSINKLNTISAIKKSTDSIAPSFQVVPSAIFILKREKQTFSLEVNMP